MAGSDLAALLGGSEGGGLALLVEQEVKVKDYGMSGSRKIAVK
jgi:hypothetical protein